MALKESTVTAVTEEAFDKWIGAAGASALEETAQSVSALESTLSLGSKKAARKKLWKITEENAQDTGLRALIESHANAFPEYLATVATELAPHGVLPDSGGAAFPNVKALPRYVVDEYALRKFQSQADAAPMRKIGASLDLDAFVRGWIERFDAEYISDFKFDKETPYLLKDPYETSGDWVVLGFDSDYEWKTDAIRGHFVLCHGSLKTYKKYSRQDRDDAEQNVIKLETELAGYDLKRRAEVFVAIEAHFPL